MRTDEKNEILELNVGGFNYTTSRSTVMSYPESMLARMISGNLPTAKDSRQRIFIDRDGPLFRFVLNFLRDKCLNLPENFNEFNQLRQEADFYQIEPLIGHLDSFFLDKTQPSKDLKKSLSAASSMLSLAHSPVSTCQYVTIMSKLYHGSLESLTGCIKILNLLTALDNNSRRFVNSLIKQFRPASSSGGEIKSVEIDMNRVNLNPADSSSAAPVLPPSVDPIDSLVCECKFMHEDKIICCKPCGLNGKQDANLAHLSQLIVRLSKRYGITIGYWEDTFYLTLSGSLPNREQFSSVLRNNNKGKLLSSNVCDKRSDDTSKITLVERWYLETI